MLVLRKSQSFHFLWHQWYVYVCNYVILKETLIECQWHLACSYVNIAWYGGDKLPHPGLSLWHFCLIVCGSFVILSITNLAIKIKTYLCMNILLILYQWFRLTLVAILMYTHLFELRLAVLWRITMSRNVYYYFELNETLKRLLKPSVTMYTPLVSAGDVNVDCLCVLPNDIQPTYTYIVYIYWHCYLYIFGLAFCRT